MRVTRAVMAKVLSGKICLVTGGTRGLGLGIANQLGGQGATVYVTGRTLKRKPGSISGSLEDTAREIESRGGKCVPVVCDHTKDEDIAALFQKIQRDEGRLDILVNNAYAAVTAIMDCIGVPFWEQPMSMWDTVNNVGLRNHYLCSTHAAKMMTPRKEGLIVNISSPAGLRYLFNIPYGVGKEALDRMAADCAIELINHNVAMVSMWPGVVNTETVSDTMSKDKFDKAAYYQPGVGDVNADQLRETFQEGETAEYAGMCIIALSQDRKLMKKSGKTLMTGDLGREYGIVDLDGRKPPSPRSLSFLLNNAGYRRLSYLFPGFIKLPYSIFALAGSKF